MTPKYAEIYDTEVTLEVYNDSIRFDMFNVLGDNWDPTDQKTAQ